MLSRRPPMGFNTWNTFGTNINADMIKETADAMVDLGLRDAGYTYLVIDDCWSKKERDPQTDKIVPDPEKFPEGMKAVSDYVHSKGLKFGMYSCAGVRTCGNYPGSFGHEFLDAKTFAEYGADFLKYDFCYVPSNVNGPLLYRKMGMALKACGREILYSACNWGSDEVNKWIRSTGAHMYRSTGDIIDCFRSFKDISLSQLDNYAYSAPGCFNDIDMLTVGMYGSGNVGDAGGCNDTEYKTEFALWCMFSSPLMLGSDIRKMNDVTLGLVKNKNLLRINQDEEARPAFKVDQVCESYTFAKLLSDNEIAVLFVNLGEDRTAPRLFFDSIGLDVSYGLGLEMVDAFTGENIGVKKEFMDVPLDPHDCKVFLCKIK